MGLHQVEQAIEESRSLRPRPGIIVFAAFGFDAEASECIDSTDCRGVDLLKVHMNADLLTSDLKRGQSSNESFWLIGQPDIVVHRIADGSGRRADGQPGAEFEFRVEVEGFDYFDMADDGIESGGANRIAMWMLDTDYDGRCFCPSQVFFPMAGPRDGWDRLAKSLRSEIDMDRIEAYRGTESLPFDAGEHNRIAVKIVDDRGVESMKIVDLGEVVP